MSSFISFDNDNKLFIEIYSLLQNYGGRRIKKINLECYNKFFIFSLEYYFYPMYKTFKIKTKFCGTIFTKKRF